MSAAPRTSARRCRPPRDQVETSPVRSLPLACGGPATAGGRKSRDAASAYCKVNLPMAGDRARNSFPQFLADLEQGLTVWHLVVHVDCIVIDETKLPNHIDQPGDARRN